MGRVGRGSQGFPEFTRSKAAHFVSRGTPSLFVILLCVACSASVSQRHDATLRIYLARHGQTDWNAERRLQGQSDRSLNAAGREQAARLATFMEPIPLDAVYSSTLSRSRETAGVARGSAPLTSLDGLREQQLGKFEGLRLSGPDTARVAEFRRRIADREDDLDGGESAEQFFSRVRETMHSIVQRHTSGSILIVGHGGTNQMILRSLLDLTSEQADSIHQANDEVYLVEMEKGEPPRLWKRITVEHLGDL